MLTIEAEAKIDGPVGVVFGALADPMVQITFDPMMLAIEKLTPGPIGEGTRFRGRFKLTGTVEYEYAEFVIGRLIVQAMRLWFGSLQHRFELDPSGNGTRLRQMITVRPKLPGLVVWPIVGWFCRHRMRTLSDLLQGYARGVSGQTTEGAASTDP